MIYRKKQTGKTNGHIDFKQAIGAILLVGICALACFDTTVSADIKSFTPTRKAEAKEMPNTGLQAQYDQADAWLAGTPMAELGKTIVDSANKKDVDFRIVIGIAKIESNFATHFYFPYDRDNCHNAWGIKPPTKSGRRADGSYLRCFNSWQDGVNSIVGLLSRRYAGQSPEQMNCVYVQPCNQNWVNVINRYVKSYPQQ